MKTKQNHAMADALNAAIGVVMGDHIDSEGMIVPIRVECAGETIWWLLRDFQLNVPDVWITTHYGQCDWVAGEPSKDELDEFLEEIGQ